MTKEQGLSVQAIIAESYRRKLQAEEKERESFVRESSLKYLINFYLNLTENKSGSLPEEEMSALRDEKLKKLRLEALAKQKINPEEGDQLIMHAYYFEVAADYLESFSPPREVEYKEGFYSKRYAIDDSIAEEFAKFIVEKKEDFLTDKSLPKKIKDNMEKITVESLLQASNEKALEYVAQKEGAASAARASQEDAGGGHVGKRRRREEEEEEEVEDKSPEASSSQPRHNEKNGWFFHSFPPPIF